jgi:hypothetical protein
MAGMLRINRRGRIAVAAIAVALLITAIIWLFGI